MLVRYSVLAWQSFIRTSHLLAGVIPDKPLAVIHTGKDYPGQATCCLNWQGLSWTGHFRLAESC